MERERKKDRQTEGGGWCWSCLIGADVDIRNNYDDEDDEPHSSAGLVLTGLCSPSLQSPLNINPCRLTASAI